MADSVTMPQRGIKEKKPLLEELNVLMEFLESPDYDSISYHEQVEAQFQRWRLIHKYFHKNPFQVSETPPRAEQWGKVLDHIKKTVADPELVDWLIVQKEVAENIAAGIRDLRPRRSEPCYELLLGYVANRKRKALAVLHWAKGQGSPKFPSFSGSKPPPSPGK